MSDLEIADKKFEKFLEEKHPDWTKENHPDKWVLLYEAFIRGFFSALDEIKNLYKQAGKPLDNK